ncbi:MAG: hypothetical protein IKF11_01370 [Methanobrevibacter sp.]|nr:hypothetical protein [Methanobrevibacter sp.]
MKLNDNNYKMKHAEWYCPSCKCTDYSLLDEVHGEIFCAHCGTVLGEFHTKHLL